MEDKWDESLLENLPKEAQARFVRVMRDLVVADVAREYDLNPQELLEGLPDPIQKALGPDHYRILCEEIALKKRAEQNPVAVKSVGELLDAGLKKLREGVEDG